LSHDSKGPPYGKRTSPADSSLRRKQGIRTYVLLVLGMAVVTLIVTSLCALIIRDRWRAQVTDDLSQDLEHSVTAFQDLQAERLGALERENALLAELPTLKALMTSGDDLTIQDGAVEFWQISGTDLFALADPAAESLRLIRRVERLSSILQDGLKSLLIHQASTISLTANLCMHVRCVRCTSAAMKTERCWGM
jgi:hypothetical protein